MNVITYAVLRVDAEGASYFEECAAELRPTVYVPGIPLVDVADGTRVSVLTLSRCGENYVSDWHPAPRRQFVLIPEGGLDVTSGQRETRRFEPGAIFLVEDITGEGHQTRTVGAEPCVFVTVACAEPNSPDRTPALTIRDQQHSRGLPGARANEGSGLTRRDACNLVFPQRLSVPSDGVAHLKLPAWSSMAGQSAGRAQ